MKRKRPFFNHAKRELDIVLTFCKTEQQKTEQEKVNKAILKVLHTVDSLDLTDNQMAYASDKLKSLLTLKPITPLIGSPEEWTKIDGEDFMRNRRCTAVVKKDNKVYDTCALVLYSLQANHTQIQQGMPKTAPQEITFPYMPKCTSYVILNNDDPNKSALMPIEHWAKLDDKQKVECWEAAQKAKALAENAPKEGEPNEQQ